MVSYLLEADDWLGRLAGVDWRRGFQPGSEGDHHGWLAFLALAHEETGGVAHGLGAAVGLESWLDGGFIESGQDPEVVASRLLSWSVSIPRLGSVLSPELSQRVFAAVEKQAHWLHAQRLKGGGSVRPLAALVAADLTFPARQGKRRWWSGALTSLGRLMPRLVRPDGTPLPAVRNQLVPILEALEIAGACCVREGVGLPAGLEAAIRSARAYLSALGEGAWEVGEWGHVHFGGGAWRRSDLMQTPTAVWDLHAFREGGEVVAYGRYREREMRLRLSVSDGRWTGRTHGLSWGLEGLPILHEPSWGSVGGGWMAGVVRSARVDGRQLQVVTEPQTWRGELGDRVVRLEGARLRVTDRIRRRHGAFSMWWHFGEDWRDWSEVSGRWRASCGTRALEVKTGTGLEWRLEHTLWGGVALVGEGEVVPGQRIPMSIELRG